MAKNDGGNIKNKFFKRLTLNIDPQKHKEIKMRATFLGMTMAEWVNIAVDQRLIEEDKYNK